MVSALVPGSSGPKSSSGRVHCFVVLGTTLYSHNSTFHQVYRWVPANLKSRQPCDGLASHSVKSRNTPSPALHAKITEISFGPMGHLARMQTLPAFSFIVAFLFCGSDITVVSFLAITRSSRSPCSSTLFQDEVTKLKRERSSHKFVSNQKKFQGTFLPTAHLKPNF